MEETKNNSFFESYKKEMRDVKLELDELNKKIMEAKGETKKEQSLDKATLQNQISKNAEDIQTFADMAEDDHDKIILHNVQISQNRTDIRKNQSAIEVVETRVDDLEDTLEEMTGGIAEVTASDVNSQSATSGQVLTANGTGGASWQTVSAGLSTVQDSDIDSETATQGQVLTADGNGGASWENVSASGGMTQEQETKLNQAYNYYLTHVVEPDPYYAPQTFSDYPAGTILQGYAKFERNYSISYNYTIKSPDMIFYAENNSVGTIHLKIKFTPNINTSCIISVKNNGNVIYSESIANIAASSQYVYETEIIGVTLNNSNNITFEVESNPSTAKFALNYVKCEIIAPNAECINYLSPYVVEYFDGKYYITDCSSGTAKIATINVEDMFNMSNLVWEDTGIACWQYKVSFCFDKYSQSYQVADRIDYYMGTDGEIHFINQETNKTLTKTTQFMVDWQQVRDTNTKYLFQNGISKSGIMIVYRTMSSWGQTLRYDRLYYSFSAAKHNHVYYNDTYTAKEVGVFGDIEGNLYAEYTGTGGIPRLNIGWGTCPHTYYTGIQSTSSSFDTYAKYFDKIVKYSYSYDTTNKFQLVSSQEIGAYEEYFEGVDNDYFVVKNGQLEYHKKV